MPQQLRENKECPYKRSGEGSGSMSQRWNPSQGWYATLDLSPKAEKRFKTGIKEAQPPGTCSSETGFTLHFCSMAAFL